MVAPIDGPLAAVVQVPGSKSITNRALICAALAEGSSVLTGALDADDTAAMIGALRVLGAGIDVGAGHVVTIKGLAGSIDVSDARVDARMSGTTSRFLLPLASLAAGAVTIDGAPQLRARPMADGIEALMSLGSRVESTSGSLPITVWPAPATSRRPVLTSVERRRVSSSPDCCWLRPVCSTVSICACPEPCGRAPTSR